MVMKLKPTWLMIGESHLQIHAGLATFATAKRPSQQGKGDHLVGKYVLFDKEYKGR